MIEFRAVSKRYGSVVAVDNLNLTIARGSCVALLGHNGAGKSTALGIALGHTRCDSGSVSIDGRHGGRAREKIGGLSQTSAFPQNIKVREIVSFVKSHYTAGPTVEELSDVFDLAPIWDRLASELSGGQSRRLAVALALAGEKECLVLDEPTTGLDPLSRKHLWSVFARFRDLGGTIVFSTHDIIEAERLADEIVLMSSGKIVARGDLEEIRSRFSTEMVRFRLSPSSSGLDSRWSASFDGEYHSLSGNADEIVRRLVSQNVAFEGLCIDRSSIEAVYMTADSA